MVQGDFYSQLVEHKGLSQYVLEVKHITFQITSTNDIVSKLPMGEDRKSLN